MKKEGIEMIKKEGIKKELLEQTRIRLAQISGLISKKNNPGFKLTYFYFAEIQKKLEEAINFYNETKLI